MWDYSHRKQTALTLRCSPSTFLFKNFWKGLFMLVFVFNIYSISCSEEYCFIRELWYFFNSCYFWWWFFDFLKTGVSISQFLLVSLCSNHQGQWHMTITLQHIMILSRRKDPGLIMSALCYIRFMVSNLKLINQKSVSLCPRLAISLPFRNFCPIQNNKKFQKIVGIWIKQRLSYI